MDAIEKVNEDPNDKMEGTPMRQSLIGCQKEIYGKCIRYQKHLMIIKETAILKPILGNKPSYYTQAWKIFILLL